MTIKYLENPFTDEEKAVGALLEHTIKSLNQDRKEDFLCSFSNNSVITSPFSRRTIIFSKETYRKHLYNHPFPSGIYSLQNVLIKVSETKNEASVTGLLYPLFGSSSPRAVKRNFHLVKQHGQWLITRASNEL